MLLSLLNLLLTLRRVFREQLQLPNLSGDLLWREIVHIAESQADALFRAITGKRVLHIQMYRREDICQNIIKIVFIDVRCCSL
ncbi:hypothetical protein ECP030186711_4169 [Escherichia coli P0301867.11]|nr:hypothetical protein ECP030186711_4169 [Escherichia coli P0301867.11]